MIWLSSQSDPIPVDMIHRAASQSNETWARQHARSQLLFVGLCAPLVQFISGAEDACICWVTTIVVLMFVIWVLSVDGVRLTVGLAALAVHLEEGRADFWGDGIHAKQILPTRTARIRIPRSPQVRQNQTMERILLSKCLDCGICRFGHVATA